ncbi:hypothetical protein [Slackia heliotrinireducens]|jgi:hypothetical protein|uniref:TerY-C metal binding domain-containing protein n=1 Tax=Slackia heliotrinireducens (strain ATCC 29202 / DSM 20476 / NCTC 11029 / RHS 1) TaxID=471855 RepID=C7N2E8_SLAHD|nr:hypothetical protein [Slackia heliotrinireducens]ACV21454.1 hypothetical protein Shel_03930 [Slackia heliotrinireducens DSM 20476]VEG98893.1 Uncharacterised protein [Slackia heliotrinireducens]
MMKEKTVVLSKCASCGQLFGITMERIGGIWHCVWAFKISESMAHFEGYGDEPVSGNIFVSDEYPGCPYCGNMGWVSCGDCKKLTCYGAEIGSDFTCAWCGHSGATEAADSFELRGGGM